jgi:hypothetical protein
MTKNLNKPRRLSFLLAAVAALALTVASTKASAAVDGTVTVIEYFPNSLLVQVASVNYFAVTATVAGCTANNRTLDDIKIFASMSQAALLAGKTVRIYFTTCGGVNYIGGFDLDK